MNKEYYYFDHKADIGIHCKGKNLKSLFLNSVNALYELILGENFKFILEKESIQIYLTAAELEDIFAQWINEIIYFAYVQKIIFSKFEFIKLNKYQLKANAYGQKLNKDTKFLRELKGITYHNFYVKKINKIWETKFIIDV